MDGPLFPNGGIRSNPNWGEGGGGGGGEPYTVEGYYTYMNEP